MSNAFKKSLEKISRLASEGRSSSFAVNAANTQDDVISEEAASLLEALGDAITLHGESGKLVWASQNATDILQSDIEQLSGYGFINALNPQDKVSLLQMINDCGQGKTVSAVKVRKMRSGSDSGLETRILECRASLHSGTKAKSQNPMVLLVTRDITEQAQKLEIADSRIDIAESASKLKSTFISNVSHELRTPLNAIIGFSEMLEGKTGLSFSENAKLEYAGLINQSATHLLNVLNDVLDVSKIEAGKFNIQPELFDVSEATLSTIKLVAPIAQKSSVSLKTDFADELPELYADKRAIRQITLNLIANAIKFSTAKSEVHISLKRTARNLCIIVKDFGIGMDDETLEQLGSKFFQAEQSTKRRFEGTGLGLSIVKGLVELHEGSIRFDSKVDEGTTVTVNLPLTRPKINPVPSNPDDTMIILKSPSVEKAKPFTIKNIQKTG